MNIKMNEAQFDLVVEMILRQQEERKEQFATLIGKIDSDMNLDVDMFDIWSEDMLNQTETSVEPKEEKNWDWVLYNIKQKNCDFIITLHTHPEWFGSQILDATDSQTFKEWSNFFQEQMNEVICINGIAAENGGLMFIIYDKKTDKFTRVDYQVENQIIPSPRRR